MALTPVPTAAIWQLRTRILALPRCPLLMGIINVTPDSFSDGGRFFDSKAAVTQAEKLADDGADLLDIGGESTRPGAKPVSQQEELDRVMPVVEVICQRLSQPISIDTSKAAVARAALDGGAEIINDISALRADPNMLGVARETKAAVCAMHMQGTPQTMQLNPRYDDVLKDVFHFLRETRDRLIAAGIAQSRLALDPGIGFGKTPDHNLALLSDCWRFHELGCPILVGHSRKSFLSHLVSGSSQPPEDRQQVHDTYHRLPATIGVACALAGQRIQILRVHDVAPIRQALQLFEATLLSTS